MFWTVAKILLGIFWANTQNLVFLELFFLEPLETIVKTRQLQFADRLMAGAVTHPFDNIATGQWVTITIETCVHI